MTLFSPPVTALKRNRAVLHLIRLGRLMCRWGAAVISNYDRRAALAALRELDDRALKDIGLHPSQIEGAFEQAAQFRRRPPDRR
ncbi:uncharacterized protein YjiS (DUF1127 family) [Bradyrhizobium japonicum]